MNDPAATEDGGDLGPYVPGAAVPGRRRSPAKVAVAAGLAMAMVAGVLALASLTSDGGSGTPEDAARKLIDAVAAEDVLGALEALVPAERAVLRDRLVDVAGELGRLGVLDDDVDLDGVQGADIAVDDLQLRSEALADDVASVLVAGGRAGLSLAVDALPLGSIVDEYNAQRRVESPAPETIELGGDDDMRLVALRADGEWFVSLGYTFADAFRRDADAPVPDFAEAVTPRGASTPEGVVEELIRAISHHYDFRRIVELTAPGEAAALHTYAPLFFDALDATVAEIRAGNHSTGLSDLEVSSSVRGDEAHVTIDRLEVDINGAEPLWFIYDGNCIVDAGIGRDRPLVCAGDPVRGPLAGTPFGGTTLTVVRRGGSWYLSPVATYIDATLATLRALDRGDVEGAVEDQGPSAILTMVNPVLELLLVGLRFDADSAMGYAPNTGCWSGSPEGAPPAASTEPVECDPPSMPSSMPATTMPLQAPPTSGPIARDLPATVPGTDPGVPTPSTTTP